jgi:hypothetical protein
MGMEFWLPGVFNPAICTVGKCCEIAIWGQYPDREAAGKHEYVGGAAYLRMSGPLHTNLRRQ